MLLTDKSISISPLHADSLRGSGCALWGSRNTTPMRVSISGIRSSIGSRAFVTAIVDARSFVSYFSELGQAKSTYLRSNGFLQYSFSFNVANVGRRALLFLVSISLLQLCGKCCPNCGPTLSALLLQTHTGLLVFWVPLFCGPGVWGPLL